MKLSAIKFFLPLWLSFLSPRCAYGQIESYGSLNLNEIVDGMKNLATLHPDFVTYGTSQQQHKLPKTCKEEHNGCYNHFLIIEDPIIYSHDQGRLAFQQRPDVFLSGALHGDERVGPVVMLHVATLLTSAASCEAGLDAIDCAQLYEKHGARTVRWLARLVSTRRIIVVPAPNSNGYYFNSRWEKYEQDNEGVSYYDPNRDFSYDQDPSKCMNTIAARSVNELFLEHLVQMSVTYHGGIENITFEWGATSVPSGKLSPDDVAQRTIAAAMSRYAGELYSTGEDRFYETGDMNSILYPVHGGFEDWAYASSWEKTYANQCTPVTYGGYDASKTNYDDATLRAFNFLVEISNRKGPSSSSYGTDEGLLSPPFLYDNNTKNGYVAKHVRTALFAVDIVEPYVEIFRYKANFFGSEIKPLKQLTRRWSRNQKNAFGGTGQKPKIRWIVGGSVEVNETFLVYGRWSDFPWLFGSVHQLTQRIIEKVLQNDSGKLYFTQVQSGETKWTNANNQIEPKFRSRIDLSHFTPGDQIAVFAIAMVDQKWNDQPENVWPDVKVQSHIVRARTDPSYRMVKADKSRIVQGRLHWISVPLTITMR